MTLLDEIKARVPQEVLATRDSQAIAYVVSAGRTKPSTVKVGKGLIVRTIGLEAANPVLDLIDAAPEYRHVRHLLVTGDLDAFDPIFQGALQALHTAGALTSDQLASMLALGSEPDPVTEFEVRCACWSDDCEWLA